MFAARHSGDHREQITRRDALRTGTLGLLGAGAGIGRGIALKLAESGAKVAVHYYQKEDQAKATLEKLRALGSDGFVVQADVCQPEEIRRMFAQIKSEFGALDIFVNNARPEVPTFYDGPMTISLDMFDFAMDSQAKAFLVGVREAVPLMRDGGRIIALTYAPGCRFGSWQPWVAMGAAKAALEVLCRYFAVALAPRQITVNAVSPGWTDDSVLNSLPQSVQDAVRNWQQAGWTPMRRLGLPADIAGRRVPARYATVEPDGAEACIVTTRGPWSRDFLVWMALLDAPLAVIGPPELAEAARVLVARLTAAA